MTRLVALSEESALELLASVNIGRLVHKPRGLPPVRVLGHLLDDDQLVLRVRLPEDLRGRPNYPARLTYQAERIDADNLTGWIVIVSGQAERITDPAVQARYRVPMRARPDERKEHLVRIYLDRVTGRLLTRDHIR
ncbi:pyridoxamine 5'-phosphate oxidase family protein [Kitasatospora indigofera]|uniref:pyridoxamine 5'-phosphate oxidase family protein n=1 Tax=Kitasatospora indigofera TaxID=67307 RepID=UPI003698CE38